MLPTLYKKTSTGKIQMWSIEVRGNQYFTISGQVTGKKIVSSPTTCEGKNVGKAHETHDSQQAELDAEARWVKQMKKGYVKTIDGARSGEVDPEYIKGGYPPMLAEKFFEMKHKIVYPCWGQPKLDGHRCVTEKNTLYSRTQKEIKSCPHITDAQRSTPFWNYTLGDVPLDGELYNHDLRDDFEELSSAITQREPQEACKVLQYHVYDVAIPRMPFNDRVSILKEIADSLQNEPAGDVIKIVPTEFIHSEEEAIERAKFWINEGYEGYMLRNGEGLYEGRRTSNLQKLKFFQDAEFPIVGIEEGKGKLAGHVGAFVCRINDAYGVRTFKAKAEGKISTLKEYFENPNLWQGQMLTVKFIKYTKKNRVPKHGTGIRFRDPNY